MEPGSAGRLQGEWSIWQMSMPESKDLCGRRSVSSAAACSVQITFRRDDSEATAFSQNGYSVSSVQFSLITSFCTHLYLCPLSLLR